MISSQSHPSRDTASAMPKAQLSAGSGTATAAPAEPLEEALLETFPASDPPAWWAGHFAAAPGGDAGRA